MSRKPCHRTACSRYQRKCDAKDAVVISLCCRIRNELSNIGMFLCPVLSSLCIVIVQIGLDFGTFRSNVVFHIVKKVLCFGFVCCGRLFREYLVMECFFHESLRSWLLFMSFWLACDTKFYILVFLKLCRLLFAFSRSEQ